MSLDKLNEMLNEESMSGLVRVKIEQTSIVFIFEGGEIELEIPCITDMREVLY